MKKLRDQRSEGAARWRKKGKKRGREEHSHDTPGQGIRYEIWCERVYVCVLLGAGVGVGVGGGY